MARLDAFACLERHPEEGRGVCASSLQFGFQIASGRGDGIGMCTCTYKCAYVYAVLSLAALRLGMMAFGAWV
ncbi:hypothetical protein SCHPADRAFT_173008 [Schizopora paradoxa]|uniref:Uncharacterized protein n=1 Tax=Schizopora paradoxa TaxID=27342 RepID=A0A0H2RZZ0_9AGAM|nr:hypothetical protein SCHPADRAFT_173008 [Schizopora paradoxa]